VELWSCWMVRMAGAGTVSTMSTESLLSREF